MDKANREKDRAASPVVAGAGKNGGGAPPDATAAPRRPRHIPGLSILLVALVAVLPYVNMLGNDFLDEDRQLIVANDYIRGGAGPVVFFTGDFWEDFNEGRGMVFQPLTVLSFAMHHQLGGLAPLACRQVNLLLHLAACLLLLFILRRQLPRGMLALSATLLFALHPVHTDAVNALLGRPQLLGATFFLGAWLAHLAARPRDGHQWKRSAWYALLAGVLFLLALLADGTTVALLPVVLLGDVLRQRRPTTPPPPVEEDPTDDEDFFTPDRKAAPALLGPLGRRLAGSPWISYAALTAALAQYLALRRQALGSLFGGGEIPFLDNPLASADTPVRLATAVKVLGEYLRLLIWPVNLSTDYAFNQVRLVNSLADPGFLAAAVACFALLVAAAVLAGSARGRIPALGILLFFCTIIPAGNFLIPLGEIMSERLLYLPSVGFCLVLASLLCIAGRELCGSGSMPGVEPSAKPSRAWLAALLVTLIFAGYGVRTVTRNRDWRDECTLLRSAALVSPDSARVHGRLGTRQFERDEFATAARSLERAVAIHHDFPVALYMLGRARIELGDLEGAREALVRVAELRPDHPEVLLALGAVAFRLEEPDEAADLFRRSLELAPDNIYALQSLGICLNRLGRHEEAAELFLRCVERLPEDAESRYNLAIALRGAEQLEEAEAACRSALELNDGHRGALLALADICRRTGRADEAAELQARALGEPGETPPEPVD